jgi:hypothetical protein
MQGNNKFWIWFAGMVAAGAVCLAGAMIGKTVIGYILFGAGLAGVVALLIFSFLKKDFFKGGRTKPLIYGFLIGLLLLSGLLLLVNTGSSTSSQVPAMGNSGAMPQMSGKNLDSFPQMPGGDTSGSFPQMQGNGTGSRPNSSSGNTSSGNLPSGVMPTGRNSTNSLMKTIFGWVLLGGAVLVLVLTLLPLLRKRSDLKEGRGRVMLLGFVLGALIGASAVLMFAPTSSTAFTTPQRTKGQTQSGAAAANAVTPTAEVTATATIAVTATPTRTPEPTATATPAEEVRLVVCISADYRAGLNIRDYPSETGKMMGTIPAGGCFIINGRSSAHPGWYRLASGQNGYGGINIYNDDGSTDLWIYGGNLDASEANLNTLLDIEVPAQ